MTKETEKVFGILYCEYKRRRKDGMPKRTAMQFEDGSIGTIKAFSKWQAADIEFAIQELNSARYIKRNILGDVELLEAGIEYMEAKPKEFFSYLSELFDLLSIFV